MTSELNPARVVVARNLLGLTQAQLADLSGVTQPHLSQIENGLRGLTEEVAGKLASATDLPVGFFLVTDDAIDPENLMYRRLAGARVKASNAMATQYGEATRIATRLLDAGAWQQTDLPVATSDHLTPDEIESLAAEVRQHLGYSDVDEPVRHLTRSAERLGVAFAPMLPLDDQSGSWTGHDGISSNGWTTHGRAVIGYVPSIAGDRDRFSKAHEIGHLVLHERRRSTSVKQRENEANRFAGALLLPCPVAEQHLSESLNVNGYVKMKAAYGLSIQALIRRGYDLGLISPTRYRSLNVQVSAKGWKRQEPVDVGIEKPALLWSMLIRAYGDDPYDTAVPALSATRRHLQAWIPERPKTPTPPGGRRRGLATVSQLRRVS